MQFTEDLSQIQIKLSLFGFQKCGKTTLFNIWSNKSQNAEYFPTDDMVFESFLYRYDSLDIPILLCDWGYQALMSNSASQQSTIKMYSEGVNLQVFVLSLDSIDSFEFVEGAPNSVFFKKSVGEVQQIAILNKMDLEDAGGVRESITEFVRENEIPLFEVLGTDEGEVKKMFSEMIGLYLRNNPQHRKRIEEKREKEKMEEEEKSEERKEKVKKKEKMEKKEKSGCCIIC